MYCRTLTPKNSNTKFISAPYIEGTSERVARILKPFGINLAHKSSVTLKSKLTELKDVRNTQDNAGVVYKIDCNDCNSSYIGETGRQLKQRVSEHKDDIVKKIHTSNVYHHVRDTSHSFDFNNVKILDKCNNVTSRKYIESCHTLTHHNSFNRSYDLPILYHPLLL